MNIESKLANPITKPVDAHFEEIRNTLQAQSVSRFEQMSDAFYYAIL